mmetsp:Transcript_14386/g.33886  ORF Transcript_14386/g.33886 Transcript_14386/m.33886 type:complete len:356 (+) Transcript_14386:10-1077(+)
MMFTIHAETHVGDGREAPPIGSTVLTFGIALALLDANSVKWKHSHWIEVAETPTTAHPLADQILSNGSQYVHRSTTGAEALVPFSASAVSLKASDPGGLSRLISNRIGSAVSRLMPANSKETETPVRLSVLFKASRPCVSVALSNSNMRSLRSVVPTCERMPACGRLKKPPWVNVTLSPFVAAGSSLSLANVMGTVPASTVGFWPGTCPSSTASPNALSCSASFTSSTELLLAPAPMLSVTPLATSPARDAADALDVPPAPFAPAINALVKPSVWFLSVALPAVAMLVTELRPSAAVSTKSPSKGATPSKPSTALVRALRTACPPSAAPERHATVVVEIQSDASHAVEPAIAATV